jgi:hypothetical protein
MRPDAPHDRPPGDAPSPFAGAVMPAGMPPGTDYAQEERPPEGVYYFRIYGGISAFLHAAVVLFGIALLFSPLFAPKGKTASFGGDLGAWLGGVVYVGMGLFVLVPTLAALFGGRRPWVHTLATIVIAFGMIHFCCIPILIPLLIVWLKPETKRWFGAT